MHGRGARGAGRGALPVDTSSATSACARVRPAIVSGAWPGKDHGMARTLKGLANRRRGLSGEAARPTPTF